MRKGVGKVTNEITNPDSHLRTLSVRNGIAIKNEGLVPILVICSQLTPLHWGRVEPGETWNVGNVVNMGRVWFTVSVSVYEEKNVPTVSAVVASIVALSASVIFIAGSAVFIAAATASGIMSVRGVSMVGVYSDGKTLVARGALQGDGCYAMTLQNIDGAAHTDPTPPPVDAAEAFPHPTGPADDVGGAGAMPSAVL
jgi:hypothetical protein